jgi:hypothetical protein
MPEPAIAAIAKAAGTNLIFIALLLFGHRKVRGACFDFVKWIFCIHAVGNREQQRHLQMKLSLSSLDHQRSCRNQDTPLRCKHRDFFNID